MTALAHLDLPFLEPRHHERAEGLEAWAAAQLPALIENDESRPDQATRDIVKALARGGWLDVAVAQGREARLDATAICLSRDVLASHGTMADFAFAMQGLGSGPISLFGTPEQREAYLPAVAAGRKIAAFALTEADAGSDVAATATSAVRDGDGYVLNGVKTFISNAGIADFYIVFARTGAAGAKGLSAFIVDTATPGLEVPRLIQVVSPHPLGEVRLSNCRIPASSRLGDEGAGFRIAMATLDVFRTSVGAAALGMARRAFAEAVRYAKGRTLFGNVLSSYQLTQAKLADMAVAIEASALLVYRAAWVKDTRQGRVTREASIAKLFATEQAQLVIDGAVQIHGGLGVVHGVPVERLYRDIRALRIYEGASEVQKLVIAAQYLNDG